MQEQMICQAHHCRSVGTHEITIGISTRLMVCLSHSHGRLAEISKPHATNLCSFRGCFAKADFFETELDLQQRKVMLNGAAWCLHHWEGKKAMARVTRLLKATSSTEALQPKVPQPPEPAPTVGPEIDRMLTLSTAHVHPGTLAFLEKDAQDAGSDSPFTLDLLGAPYKDYGVGCGILWNFGAPDEEPEYNKAYPWAAWPDMAEVRGYAVALGCSFVRLDPDGPQMPGLTLYLHEEQIERG